MKTVCVLKIGYDGENAHTLLSSAYTMSVGDVRRLLSWYDDDVPVIVKDRNGVYPFKSVEEIEEDCVD